MRRYESFFNREKQLEEERKKRECEPYEEIIRRLRNRDRERAESEKSPTDGKS